MANRRSGRRAGQQTKKETIKRVAGVSAEIQNPSHLHQHNMLRHFALFKLAIVLVALTNCLAEDLAVEDRAGTTVTVVTTSYFTGATTSTKLTVKVCGTLDAVTGVCRRKRQVWLDVPVVIAHDPEVQSYIRQQFEPSPVLGVEPTQVARFRDNSQQQAAIESSIGEDNQVRLGQPVLVSSVVSVKTSLISIASAVVSSFLTPVSTITSTVQAYTSTVTTTIYTGAVKTYTISACIPPNLDFTAC